MPLLAVRGNAAVRSYGFGALAQDGGSMTAIATSVPSGVSTVTFSSIPSTYDDLMIVIYGFSTTASSALRLRLNGDTATNYSRTSLVGDGATASSSNFTSADHLLSMPWRTSVPAAHQVHIINYKNTSYNKSVLAREATDENGSGSSRLTVGLYRSTSAVSSVTIYDANSYNFGAGTVFALYGITKAA